MKWTFDPFYTASNTDDTPPYLRKYTPTKDWNFDQTALLIDILIALVVIGVAMGVNELVQISAGNRSRPFHPTLETEGFHHKDAGQVRHLPAEGRQLCAEGRRKMLSRSPEWRGKIANFLRRSPKSVRRPPTFAEGRQLWRKVAKTTHTKVGDLGDLRLHSNQTTMANPDGVSFTGAGAPSHEANPLHAHRPDCSPGAASGRGRECPCGGPVRSPRDGREQPGRRCEGRTCRWRAGSANSRILSRAVVNSRSTLALPPPASTWQWRSSHAHDRAGLEILFRIVRIDEPLSGFRAMHRPRRDQADVFEHAKLVVGAAVRVGVVLVHLDLAAQDVVPCTAVANHALGTAREVPRLDLPARCPVERRSRVPSIPFASTRVASVPSSFQT